MEKIKFYFQEKLTHELIYDTWKYAFKKELIKGYWEWRFLNNPNDRKVYVGYMLEKDHLVSHYAVSPMVFQHRNELLKAGLINMAMTHPDHQGQGYLTKIAAEVHSKMKADGYDFLFSFPTRLVTLNLFRKKFNWIDICTQEIFILQKADFCFDNRLPEKIDFEVHKLDYETLLILNLFESTDKSIFSLRDFNNLKWRLLDNPQNDYHCIKICKQGLVCFVLIFKYYQSSIDIIDFFYRKNEREIINEYFPLSILYLFDQVSSINIWISNHTTIFKLLISLGFKSLGHSTFMGIIPLKTNFQYFNPNDWNITFFDSDVY